MARDAGYDFDFGHEQPESRIDLQARYERQQIAFAHWNPGAPRGIASVGLEFTNGEILVFWAVPTFDPHFTVRLVERVIPAQSIVTKRMRRRYADGRDARQKGDERQPIQSRETGQMVEDSVQRQIEGLMVRGGTLRPLPNPAGGEILDVETTDGQRIVIESFPSTDREWQTELEVRVEAVPRIYSVPRTA